MTKVYAVRVHKLGGPEQLRYEPVEVGEPGPGEARVRHTVIGLNFTDIHFRTGRYPLPAQYLIRSAYTIKQGETILVQAAAGGVGLIICQLARHLGVRVIGTVSTPEKAALAKANGCDHPIIYTREDVVARVRELTGGAGLPVVYDGVGGSTYEP